MFLEPRIHRPSQPDGRYFVFAHIEGKRFKLYNGRALSINCNPNKAKTDKDREKALSMLCYHLKKKLEQGWRPDQQTDQPKKAAAISSGRAFQQLKTQIEQEAVSSLYRRDLLALCERFASYLKKNKREATPLSSLTSDHMDEFLRPFRTTATNYMNRRRTLSSLFARLIAMKMLSSNPVKDTGKLKQIAYLNLPYKQGQLQKVLQFVRERHEDVYLCCLLMYGCLLRPHQEIRLLRRGHFDEGITKISLSGEQNKSRRIRTVLVPLYVQEELIRRGIPEFEEGVNLFTRGTGVFNASYFNTAWSRIKEDMLREGLISESHTLYSFRHTAAVNMYLKTKDPYKIQQAFGHSSLRVTLLYLRNLGLVVDTSLEDLPELPACL
ncbi:tyrosine-type recombinase/integrase [uncultured Chitinophaga sp.]|jgi:Site-specific recombinase XerC|uniref:tyrosine-type recombinase/integrase n=1 Tax=uncultured Chitinophaga sp. TaxID=339340 RepID=UPI002603BA88|nr:tyrosine-type recombinase/integrase [uncultured Chitinophaga sp.]